MVGTCGWVLNNPHFQRWSHSQNGLLWISADPGCGKSVLSRSLIDHELAATHQITTCYYFFKDNGQQDRLAPALCAVLHQLFSSQSHLLRHAITAWENNGEKIREEVDLLWQILLNATSDKTSTGVTIVFDALDECCNEDRPGLITRLCRLYEQSLKTTGCTTVRFLVTGRSYDNVQRWFEPTISTLPQIQLRGEDENDLIREEINLVIDQRLKDLAVDFHLSTQHIDQLRQRLRSMEHRTYLWLYFAMESIRNKYRYSLNPEKTLIDDLPTTVQEAYEQILRRVSDQYTSHARRILLVIVGARRPLTIGEVNLAVNAATAYEMDHPVVEEPNVSHFERRVRDWCGLFVFINHSQLFLIHQTAKEFLLTNLTVHDTNLSYWKSSMSVARIELQMAIICITYLRLAVNEQQALDPTTEVRDIRSSFFRYCAEHWSSHLRDREIAESKKLIENVLELCSTESDQFYSWFRVQWKSCRRTERVPRVHDQHVMAMNGHASVLARRYEMQKFDLNERDSTSRTALIWAAEKGHREAVQTLLNLGADVNAQGGDYGNALQAASDYGHKEVVQILLDRGADVNAQGGLMGNALQAASYNNHESVVQMLLDRKANVHVQGGLYTSALYAASRAGHEKLVRMLLDNNPDVNVQGGRFGNALQAASDHGNEKVVQILLERGADVNAQGGEYGNALQAASMRGHKKIVRILLEYGARQK